MVDSVVRTMWVSIDGPEGVGKTTLAESLAARFAEVRVLPEFSSGVVGQALARAVAVSPHRISPSEVGQSLLFIAELHEKVAVDVAGHDPAELVVTDRGPLSKYVYQVCALNRRWEFERADAWVRLLLADLPEPDLAICLLADIGTLVERLLARGQARTLEQRRFIEQVVSLFEATTDLGPRRVIDTSARDREQVLDLAVRAIEAHRLL